MEVTVGQSSHPPRAEEAPSERKSLASTGSQWDPDTIPVSLTTTSPSLEKPHPLHSGCAQPCEGARSGIWMPQLVSPFCCLPAE